MPKEILCKSCYSANPIGLERCQSCKSPLKIGNSAIKPQIRKLLLVMILIDLLIGISAIAYLYQNK